MISKNSSFFFEIRQKFSGPLIMKSLEYEIEINPSKSYWSEIFRLVIEEKWFNTPNDYQIWLKGFSKEQFQLFVAIEKGTGNFIGSVTLTTHELVNGEKISCVGTFILHPEFRGQGIGLTLFNEALKHGATNKTLVAVPSMSDKYASKFGFNVIGTKIIDYYAKCSALKLSSLLTDSRLKITDPSEVGWEKIYAYDRSITGMCFRGDFLREFFSQPGAYNKVVLNENNDIVGYCNIRTGPDNILSIGPFYANSVRLFQII
uniref:N-acetyltransferase domain-containing protein n=1 Tax=Acrobeloides nanus TaxID=290746 RepID=A0A914CT58_9BILA